MNALTIPALKKYAKEKGHVVIPREEYEWLKKTQNVRKFKVVKPTAAELRAFEGLRKDRAAGKLISLDELKRKLAAKG